jgi:cytochrome P450
MYSLIIGVIAVVFLLRRTRLSINLHRQRQLSKSENNCKEPPRYPNRDPISGLDLAWRNYVGFSTHNLLPVLAARYRTIGNTYSLRMGGARSLSTDEPENIKAVLSTNFTSYSFGSKRTNALKPFLGQSIFTVTGRAWQHSRAMIRPNLTKDQFIDAEMSTFEKHFHRLLSVVPKDGAKVDLQPLFFRFTLDTSIELLIGQDVSLKQHVTDMFDHTEGLIGYEFLLSFIPFRPSRREYLKASRLCHEWIDLYVHKAIEEHRYQASSTFAAKDMASDTGKYSLLHELVKETYDVPRVRGELIGMLTAARETTASVLSSLWFTLARQA